MANYKTGRDAVDTKLTVNCADITFTAPPIINLSFTLDEHGAEWVEIKQDGQEDKRYKTGRIFPPEQ